MKYLILVFLALLPALAPAQKTVQVRRYLGTVRYEQGRPDGEVSFVFDRVTLNRTGNGRKSYRELLTGASKFSDADNAGKLIAVTVDGRAITPDGGSEQAEGEAPRRASVMSMPVLPRLPEDSLSMSIAVDDTKRAIDDMKQQVDDLLLSLAEIVLYALNAFAAPLTAIMMILWFLAYTSANESAINRWGMPVFGKLFVKVHTWTSGSLMLMLWFVVSVYMLDIFWWVKQRNMHPAMAIFLCGLIALLAAKFVNRVVPNARIMDSKTGKYRPVPIPSDDNLRLPG